MKHSRLLLKAFLTLIVLFALNTIAPAFWNVRWFDSLEHFLGGLSVGLFALWVWYVSGLVGKDRPTKKQAFITALTCAVAVGIGWELFEYVYGVANPIGNYGIDTFQDVLADVVGGVVAGLVGGRLKNYE